MRRSSGRPLLLARLRASLLPIVLSADVSGKWIGTVTREAPAGDVQPACLILSETQGVLTRTAGPSETGQRAIKNGRIDGGRFRFDMTVGEGTMSFDLRVTRDHMTGSVTGAAPLGGTEHLTLRARRC